MEKILKQVIENKLLNKKNSIKKNLLYFMEYNTNLPYSDGPDTLTTYNWTLDKDGNIYPYTMISFSMLKESLMGIDPLNPEHDEFRNAVMKIKNIFNL